MYKKSFKTLAPLLVLAMALIAYSNSFNAEFHFDDILKITNNPAVWKLSNIPRFFAVSGDNYLLKNLEFRPLTYSTIALNYAVSGYRPWSYHLFNLALHLINCFLVFLAVRLVAASGERDGSRAYYVAFAAASLFALHPLQTGTVMYLSNGRAVMLASMLYLLAFIGFIKFRESDSTGGRAWYVWGMLAPFFYLLGFLSKEIVVSLPAVMFVYDLLFTVRRRGGLRGSYRVFLYYIPFVAVLALFVFWKWSVHGYVAVREAPFAPADYLMSEAKAFLLYIRLIFLPFNQNADYFLPVTKAMDAKSAIGFAAVAAFLALIVVLRKKEPVAAFFGAWFFIMLLPESSFVSFRDIAVEYRLYLPMAGFIAAGVSLSANSRVFRDKAVATGFVAAVLVLFGLLSFGRNTVWRTGTSFWRDVVAKSPWSPRAHANLGRALMIEKAYPEAVAEFSESLELDPGYGDAGVVHFNLGMCYFEAGLPGKAAEQFEAAAGTYADKFEAYSRLGEAFFQMGSYGKSADAYRRAMIFGGGPALQYNTATALMMDGKDAEALDILEKLLEQGFDNFDVRYDLALIYRKQGRKTDALKQARLAAGMAEDWQSGNKADALIEELGGR